MKGAKAAGKGAKAARSVRARPLKKFKDMVSLFAQTDGDARWRMIADRTAGNQ